MKEPGIVAEEAIRGILDQIDDFAGKTDRSIKDFKEVIRKQLIGIHKHVTDAHLKLLEEAIQYKEMVGETLGADKERLRRKLMLSLLKFKWAAKERALAYQIGATLQRRGHNLLQKRQDLHDEKLKLERERKPTIAAEAQIRFCDWIIEGCK